MAALGDLVQIDERTVLVLGQELDVARNQPDVGNSLVHRAGDTLVIVDTGVTAAFRAALLAATHKVGEWSRALVLTTHGHTDHVGNNDLADELGVPTEHYVPARDVAQILDPRSYWVASFTPIAGVVALPAPPSPAGNKVVSMFQPRRPCAKVTRTYEQRPLERIRIGSAWFTAWTFADGAVRVLHGQGHCAGHVIVHLRDSGILHLVDEPNGTCGAMADADQLKSHAFIGADATMFEEGVATVLTDGHTFALRRGDAAVSSLDGLFDQATAMQEVALGLNKDDASVRPSAFAARFTDALTDLGGVGPNPSPHFTAMVTTNQLREIVFRPESAVPGAPWSRPALDNPGPVPGMPHGLAMVPAAAATLCWKLRGGDKAPKNSFAK